MVSYVEFNAKKQEESFKLCGQHGTSVLPASGFGYGVLVARYFG
jgi:hypothetical protein